MPAMTTLSHSGRGLLVSFLTAARCRWQKPLDLRHKWFYAGPPETPVGACPQLFHPEQLIEIGATAYVGS